MGAQAKDHKLQAFLRLVKQTHGKDKVLILPSLLTPRASLRPKRVMPV